MRSQGRRASFGALSLVVGGGHVWLCALLGWTGSSTEMFLLFRRRSHDERLSLPLRGAPRISKRMPRSKALVRRCRRTVLPRKHNTEILRLRELHHLRVHRSCHRQRCLEVDRERMVVVRRRRSWGVTKSQRLIPLLSSLMKLQLSSRRSGP